MSAKLMLFILAAMRNGIPSMGGSWLLPRSDKVAAVVAPVLPPVAIHVACRQCALMGARWAAPSAVRPLVANARSSPCVPEHGSTGMRSEALDVVSNRAHVQEHPVPTVVNEHSAAFDADIVAVAKPTVAVSVPTAFSGRPRK